MTSTLPSTDQQATYVAVTADDAAAATHIHVVLADGRDFVVKTTNRDRIAWDRTAPQRKWTPQGQPFIFANFLAWNAARREGLFDGTFDTPGSGWLDQADDLTPVRLADAGTEGGEADGEVRPTRPAAQPA